LFLSLCLPFVVKNTEVAGRQRRNGALVERGR
jgi:hypothetical protein